MTLIDHEEVLYGLGEALVFFPRGWCETASKARYLGWKALYDVDAIDEPFDPRNVRALARYAARVTDDPWHELTHRIVQPDVPGAYPVWLVTA